MTIQRRRGGARPGRKTIIVPDPDPFIEAMKDALAMEKANEYLQKLCHLKAGPKN